LPNEYLGISLVFSVAQINQNQNILEEKDLEKKRI